MKKVIFAALFLLGTMGMSNVKAQISVNVNIGTPPAWAPYGYNDERFYFIPDIDVYYDVWYGNYWYIDRGNWISLAYLPPRYANFDFYGSYKVPISYRGGTPYVYYKNHREKYYSYRNYKGPRQKTYRDYGGYKGKARPRSDYDNQKQRKDIGKDNGRNENDRGKQIDRPRNERPQQNEYRNDKPNNRPENGGGRKGSDGGKPKQGGGKGKGGN